MAFFPSLRLRRRTILIVGILALFIAVGSNFFVFLGLTTNDIKSIKSKIPSVDDIKGKLPDVKQNLGDLKEELDDFKHELNDLRIPGVPKKPWHANEKPEAPMDPTDNHPISALMAEAEKNWRKYEDNRSTSFRNTLKKYRRNYGRHPPPGFTDWYKYARKRNVHNIDDFQQIMDDLRPFWAIEPATIRNLAANMWRDEDQGISGVHIRDHKIAKENNGNWRSETFVKLIKKFVNKLPDMDIALNRLDQPRVVVPWEDMQNHLEEEKRLRRQPPETIDEFSVGMEGFLPISDEQIVGETEGKTEDPAWYIAAGKQYMDIAKTACPPESLARQNTTVGADAMYKAPLGGLVNNFNKSSDLCTVGPQIQDLHGLLFSSSSMVATKRLVPVFGECKVNINSDILFPANMYYKHDERYDYDDRFDVDWEKKADMMVWRGVTSGGTQTAENWHNLHRQRLVMKLNSTLLVGSEARVLTETPEKKGEYENFRGFRPAKFAENHTDVGFTETPGCVPDCDFYKDVWTLKEPITLAETFKNKFVVDVDGHSFSGRWSAFLESKSLGIKATIFREWFDSRLFAWKHFVPMDNRYDDVYTLLTYFLGVGTSPEEQAQGDPFADVNSKVFVTAHSAEGKQIANQGREWAKKVLRRDDIEVRPPRCQREQPLTLNRSTCTASCWNTVASLTTTEIELGTLVMVASWTIMMVSSRATTPLSDLYRLHVYCMGLLAPGIRWRETSSTIPLIFW